MKKNAKKNEHFSFCVYNNTIQTNKLQLENLWKIKKSNPLK